uniref:Uncharacterized protein n=1 Tax=Amphimedon queenslandica TaxID=400682 RepID=A0A1X7UBP8_AMPQE
KTKNTFLKETDKKEIKKHKRKRNKEEKEIKRPITRFIHSIQSPDIILIHRSCISSSLTAPCTLVRASVA